MSGAHLRHETQAGQSSVEVVGIAILLGVIALVAWQGLVVAHTWQAAQSAARTAARAGSVGAPAQRAALAVLPDRLARRARVTTEWRGGRESVRVRLRVPVVVASFGDIGVAVEASAEVVR